MPNQESAESIPRLQFDAGRLGRKDIATAFLILRRQGIGLSVARTFNHTRRWGEERPIFGYGSCSCCETSLGLKPDGTKYHNAPQHLVRTNLYKPRIRVSDGEALETRLRTADKPAELLVWTSIETVMHRDCYLEEEMPFGQAVDRKPVATRFTVKDPEKARQQMAAQDWLAPATILVLSLRK